MDTCSVIGCEKPKRRNGPKTLYCHMHYRRMMKNGDVGSSEPKKVWSHYGEKCLVDGCQDAAKKKGMCIQHYDSEKGTTLSAQEIHNMKKSGCHVCGSFDRLTLDHDHNCCPQGRSCHNCVRGILCHKCNTAAGLLNDDPNLMISLSMYVMSKKDVLTNA